MALSKKKYQYRIYDLIGTYKGVLSDVVSEPSFNAQINSGVSELVITLAKKADDFGEGEIIALYNQVQVWCYDVDTIDGVKIFDGYIESYSPNLEEEKESIEVIIVGWAAELEHYLLEDYPASDTTITYTSDDPSDILRDVLDKYAALGGKISYDGSSIDDTGLSVTYTFNTNTVLEAIEACRQLAPAGWYWFVDPSDNKLYFKEMSSSPDILLFVGKDIVSMNPTKTIGETYNIVYFTGGGEPPLYKKYVRTGSISNYGKRSYKMIDSRVTVEGTMDTIADNFLDYYDSALTNIQMSVLDSNGPDNSVGYDIESIHPGMTVAVRNYYSIRTFTFWDIALWDVNVWDYLIEDVAATNVLITRVQYSPDIMNIDTATKAPFVSRRIEDINRNLVNYQTKDNPSSPS